ncbi:hypothetical protein KFL_002010170 [Klebsormidium nitens]|uniref:SnoaL-like domain-containing protein n=1 Tax=Klebsormidium nitens TaxID=105231 RepID=A0A0U9HT91_KLENI|nr:hypothetical protein KFL_002010170 [Klebsormidium nitens]|eukprot:GAQ84701.1 hypothetical protein KFL_002010170 [Klebsormidium nitens]
MGTFSDPPPCPEEQLILDFFEAVNDKDSDRLLKMFHPDYESEQPCYPTRNFKGGEQVLRNYEALSKFKSVKYTVHRTAFKQEGPGRVTGFVECSLQDAENKVNVKGVFIYETQDKLLRKGSLYMTPVQSSGHSIAEHFRIVSEKGKW